MIISASRRTDIPAFYSEWFLNRIRAGHVWVPNPYNSKTVSCIRLDPAVVDCIVFWTKNPAPMLSRLGGLENYDYYFQYTLNPYGPDAEKQLPPLSARIETFKRLSERIGRERVIWRYDPLFTNDKYTVEFHKEAFAQLVEALKDHTERCMLGFIDHYSHIQKAMRAQSIHPLTEQEIEQTARSFKRTCEALSLRLDTCTAKVDLRRLGIPSGLCVDRELIERITGCPITARKDKNQRAVCNCIESIDIGTYESCLNGCVYCYAIRGDCRTAAAASRRHDPTSPLLIGTPDDLAGDATVRNREMKSLKNTQPTLPM